MLSQTFSTSSKPPEPFDVKELVAMLDKVGEPQGVVLLPNGSGFDVFQFPSVLLKGAISLMRRDYYNCWVARLHKCPNYVKRSETSV